MEAGGIESEATCQKLRVFRGAVLRRVAPCGADWTLGSNRSWALCPGGNPRACRRLDKAAPRRYERKQSSGGEAWDRQSLFMEI